MWFIFHWAMYSPKKNKCSNEIEGQDKKYGRKIGSLCHNLFVVSCEFSHFIYFQIC